MKQINIDDDKVVLVPDYWIWQFGGLIFGLIIGVAIVIFFIK